MNRDAIDRVARVFGSVGSRRAALGLLAAVGIAGTPKAASGKKNHQRKRAAVTAQAFCSSPGSGANLNGCDFTGDDFANADLHGSAMKGTIFRDADLRGADLHGSNAKGAIFRNADLCGAKLYSSALANANFNGANLRGADLHSSGCSAISVSSATQFCETITCNGKINNRDCADDPLAQGVCCFDSDCLLGAVCDGDTNRCCFPTGYPVNALPGRFCCSGVNVAGFCL